MRRSIIILSICALAVAITLHFAMTTTSFNQDSTPARPLPAADDITGHHQLVGGIRVAWLKAPSGYLYFWHPNATAEEEQITGGNNNDKVVEIAQQIHPQLIIDFSPSMFHYGFREPAITAAAGALVEFARAGRARTRLNLDINPIPNATLTTFSGGTYSENVDLLGAHGTPGPAGQHLVDQAARRVGGNTQPERAFDELFRAVAGEASSVCAPVLYPVVFLTDGEFNGRPSGGTYGPYWEHMATKMQQQLKRVKNSTCGGRASQMHIAALGVANDKLTQIKEMKDAFVKAGIPFTYLTSANAHEIPRAFQRAVNLSLSASSATARLIRKTRNNNIGDVLDLTEGSVFAASLEDGISFENDGGNQKPREWDLASLLHPYHFSRELDTPTKRRATVAAAADVVLRMKLDLETFRSQLANSQTQEDPDALRKLSEAVGIALQRYQDTEVPPLLSQLPNHVVPCSFFENRPCTDPNEKMAYASPFLAWLKEGVLELAVFQEMLSAAVGATTEKERFEHVSAASDSNTVAMTVNETYDEVVLNDVNVEVAAPTMAAFTASSSASRSSTSSKSESESLSQTVNAARSRAKKNWRKN